MMRPDVVIGQTPRFTELLLNVAHAADAAQRQA